MPGNRLRPVFETVLKNLRIGNGCWEWAGAKSGHGYAVIYSGGGKSLLGHRVVYELVCGSIPDGLEIDHLCRNRSCVRPDHLEPVTHAENIRRTGPFKKWEKCAKGHPLSGENLKSMGRGKFRCKACHREQSRKRIERFRQKSLCFCGRVTDGGFNCCAKCRARARAYQMSKYCESKPQPCPKKEVA